MEIQEAGATNGPIVVVRPRDRMRQLGVGKKGLATLIEKHGHPKPFKLGNRSSGFSQAACDAWTKQRMAESDAA